MALNRTQGWYEQASHPNSLADYNWSSQPRITLPKKQVLILELPIAQVLDPPYIRQCIKHPMYTKPGHVEWHTDQPYDPLEPVIISIECLYGLYSIQALVHLLACAAKIEEGDVNRALNYSKMWAFNPSSKQAQNTRDIYNLVLRTKHNNNDRNKIGA